VIVKTVQIDRDSRGNWTEAQLPDGQVLRYGYDDQGQLVQFQNGAIISRYAYDAAGQVQYGPTDLPQFCGSSEGDRCRQPRGGSH
jgi:YD repeat-containing protein